MAPKKKEKETRCTMHELQREFGVGTSNLPSCSGLTEGNEKASFDRKGSRRGIEPRWADVEDDADDFELMRRMPEPEREVDFADVRAAREPTTSGTARRSDAVGRRGMRENNSDFRRVDTDDRGDVEDAMMWRQRGGGTRGTDRGAEPEEKRMEAWRGGDGGSRLDRDREVDDAEWRAAPSTDTNKREATEEDVADWRGGDRSGSLSKRGGTGRRTGEGPLRANTPGNRDEDNLDFSMLRRDARTTTKSPEVSMHTPSKGCYVPPRRRFAQQQHQEDLGPKRVAEAACSSQEPGEPESPPDRKLGTEGVSPIPGKADSGTAVSGAVHNVTQKEKPHALPAASCSHHEPVEQDGEVGKQKMDPKSGGAEEVLPENRKITTEGEECVAATTSPVDDDRSDKGRATQSGSSDVNGGSVPAKVAYEPPWKKKQREQSEALGSAKLPSTKTDEVKTLEPVRLGTLRNAGYNGPVNDKPGSSSPTKSSTGGNKYVPPSLRDAPREQGQGSENRQGPSAFQQGSHFTKKGNAGQDQLREIMAKLSTATKGGSTRKPGAVASASDAASLVGTRDADVKAKDDAAKAQLQSRERERAAKQAEESRKALERQREKELLYQCEIEQMKLFKEEVEKALWPDVAAIPETKLAGLGENAHSIGPSLILIALLLLKGCSVTDRNEMHKVLEVLKPTIKFLFESSGIAGHRLLALYESSAIAHCLNYPRIDGQWALIEAFWDSLYMLNIIPEADFMTWFSDSHDDSAARQKTMFQVLAWFDWLQSAKSADEADDSDGGDAEEDIDIEANVPKRVAVKPVRSRITSTALGASIK